MACFIWFFAVISILFSVFFVKSSCAVSTNSSRIRDSYIYYLDSDLPSTWYNNNSVIMDGWQMRVFLVMQQQDTDYYCGFYCSGICDSYLFSVVSVKAQNPTIVWSANSSSSVQVNAEVQLTTGGLELRDSDGRQVWSTNTSGNSVLGMYLNETGNLVLFDNENVELWRSPSNTTSSDIQVPSESPQPLPDTPVVKIPPPPSTSHTKGRSLVPIIAGSIAGSLVIFCTMIVIFCVKSRKPNEEDEGENIKQVPGMILRFSYEELRLATEDFKEKLGSGGYGSVFKGVLPDGTIIAVKRLHRMKSGKSEFLAEVETIGSLHHFNLVRLIGFCAEKTWRLLVFEYLSNGSLDNWIYYRDGSTCLDWQTRKKIILDIAKGLAYLHEDCRQKIMHLDIKPQNILLDENFNAKVSDFGMSKLIDRNETQVLTTMRGTPGYLAPEWRELIITVKVDIYSFGIVLLEIVSARKNLDRLRAESSLQLLKVLQKKAEDDCLMDVLENLDEDMQENREEVLRMIKIGIWCLQDDYRNRPLASTIVKVLEGLMEVNPNIVYKFSLALDSGATASTSDRVSSAPPPPSFLSAPR